MRTALRARSIGVLAAGAFCLGTAASAHAQTPAPADPSPPPAPLVPVSPAAPAPVAPADVAPPAPPVTVDPSAHWPVSAEDEEERLGRFLDAQRSVELSQYWSVALGALAVGAPQIVLGSYLQNQTDVAAQAIGPGLVVGGIADCVIGFVPLLAPTPMSTLRGVYQAEKQQGRPAWEVVRDTEETWRHLVVEQRRARLWSGIFDLVVGIPPFVTGLVFALAKPGLAGMSSQTQYGWAGALVGFDFLIYQGIVAIAAPPPVDTAFDTYQLLKHGGADPVKPSLSFAPVPGGGTIGIGATF